MDRVTFRERLIRRYQQAGLSGLRDSTLRRFGLRQLPLQKALAQLDRKPHFSIVQIGAYIGATDDDPLAESLMGMLPQRAREGRTATVVLIEPVQEYFDQLRRNYAGIPFVHFVNAAIAETEGKRSFYRVNVDPKQFGLPDWLAEMGSLRREIAAPILETYAKKYGAFLCEHRVEETVDCVRLETVLASHGIKDDLDMLQIDAEGYDYEILCSIDFTQLRPTYINFERVLLEDREPACRAMMRAAGYSLMDWGLDTLCIRAWRNADSRRTATVASARRS